MNYYLADLDIDYPIKGFSKEQVLNLTYKDIERLSAIESPEDSVESKDCKNSKSKDPNQGGPRPPKEEEFPDYDTFPEVSNPNGKDN